MGLAKHVFGVGLVGMALLVSGFVYYQKVVGETRQQGSSVPYSHLVEWLHAQGQAETIV